MKVRPTGRAPGYADTVEFPDLRYAPALRTPYDGAVVELPPPPGLHGCRLSEAVGMRRSARAPAPGAPELLPVLSALLHYTLRLHGDRRRVPSAGALHPLECYIAAEGALYWYDPSAHHLVAVAGHPDAVRERAAQAMGADEPPRAVLLACEREGRTRVKYGKGYGGALVAREVGVLYGYWGLLCAALGAGGCCLGPMAWRVAGWSCERPRGAFAVW